MNSSSSHSDGVPSSGETVPQPVCVEYNSLVELVGEDSVAGMAARCIAKLHDEKDLNYVLSIVPYLVACLYVDIARTMMPDYPKRDYDFVMAKFDTLFVQNIWGFVIFLVAIIALYFSSRLSIQTRVWELYERYRQNINNSAFMESVKDIVDDYPFAKSSNRKIKFTKRTANRSIWTVYIVGTTDWSPSVDISRFRSGIGEPRPDKALLESANLHAIKAVEIEKVDGTDDKSNEAFYLKVIFCAFVFLSLSVSLFGSPIALALPNWICITAITIAILRLIDLDGKRIKERMNHLLGRFGVYPFLSTILLVVYNHPLVIVLVCLPFVMALRQTLPFYMAYRLITEDLLTGVIQNENAGGIGKDA